MSHSALQVAVRQSPGGGVVATFTGDAGIDQISEFERQLRLLGVVPASTIVLDLSGLTHIASMGLGALIRFRNDTQQATVKLAALQPQVLSAFKKSKLDQVFQIYPTVDAALA